MVNLSPKQGLFIQDWQLAIVKPLIKNINMGTENNSCRVKSTLCFVSKIVDKVVKHQLTDNFNMQSLIPTHQNAYRTFYSTEHTILDLCNHILTNMEGNENIAIIVLDLSATIDTVNHKILIIVLENYLSIWDKGIKLDNVTS